MTYPWDVVNPMCNGRCEPMCKTCHKLADEAANNRLLDEAVDTSDPRPVKSKARMVKCTDCGGTGRTLTGECAPCSGFGETEA